MAIDLSWLPQGANSGKLPLGMRVNNPGNIKYFKGLSYPGMVGPSGAGHTDQGDPQMTFDTPYSGMNAMSSLAMKKYRGGKRTAMDLISGKMGWTPGNTAAAANVARTMGIDPNADLNLTDPKQMTAFLRALTRQEHGESASLYGDDVYTKAASYAIDGTPATGTTSPVAQALNTGEPTNMPGPIGGAPVAGGPMPMLDPPSIRKSKLAEALLSQSLGAKVTGWGDALRSLSGTYVGQQMGDKYDTEQKAYRSKLAEALGGASAENLPQVLIGSGDDDLVKQGVAMKVASSKPQQPQVGRFRTDADGNVLDSATGQIVVQGKGKKENAPAGYRTTEDGNLAAIPGGPADPATKPKGRDKWTEVQSKAANFGNMMVNADTQLATMSPKGPDGKPMPMENPKNFLGAIRDGIVPGEAVRNVMTPNDTQAYNQIAKQWIRAKLRKESGAAIGVDEMEQEFRTYFPQYGDGPEVLKQKAAARAEATKGMIAESGGAYGDMFPQTGAAAEASPPVASPPAATQAPPVAGPVAPSPKAVEFLRGQPTPEIIAQFNAKYGPGAAEKVLSAQPQQPTPEASILPPTGY
jgi:hypothetical protein